ncbi:FAD-dependent monooxygenase [Pseudonocardia ailaonensis]|uniref:FAD-dependent monooxygenase n=1 Tax=Pseudonocardia ailaonensis TaxID=367279 RepID=A0ABN2NJ51_9PSEU
MTRVLVVGAGIAGSTLAWWLARGGTEVTVVERTAGRRSSGSPVDVRGAATPVVARMGLAEQLRAAATRTTEMALVDEAGRRIARMPVQSGDGIELPRADLARILGEAAQGSAEFRFGDTVTALAGDPHGVDVTFAQARPERFDLVVGADGLHSRVRRLAFGPDSRFVRHLGMHVATVALDGAADPSTVRMHNAPGRALAIHPATGRELAAFLFRGPLAPGVAPIDLLDATYRGVGWRVPEVLERARAADDLWYDAVSRVRLPSWSRGRIALVGDAASCVSLLGEGSSLAIAGAATLAAALATEPVEVALRRYEHAHRRRTTPRGRAAGVMSHFLVPATGGGIALRNRALRFVA